ncbi:hypothetical protein CBR_g41751 [Chara braunii]|uniref:Uncharacterized protein n=1 Tax=Chara braunii TaxID=69332 RepID=A0A388LWI3_CHABU|nr:hypothetical protein CBR_g41751 [Chara braunii]|eukprot:GBG86688.1 hypothetical protein CBR_g41751 [Chara braunii]
MKGLHPSPVGRDGQPIRFDSTNLREFLWAYDQYADDLNILGEQRMGSFLLYVRRHIRSFVRSIVAPAMNWGHCKKLLWNHYAPARQAGKRRSLENRSREPEATERRTFEQGMSSRTQREDRRKEHKAHMHERVGGLGGSDVPPHPAQLDVDYPMSDIEPDLPHEPLVQEQREEQSPKEKELDRKERAAREQEIKVQLRMKNLAELCERMQQGKESEEVGDKGGKGACTQEKDLPLVSKVLVSFDRLMEAAGRSGEHHQEMGVKLVSTNLLNLRGVMKEGFAAAKASDQKAGGKLTKVAQKGALAEKDAGGGKFEWRMPAGLTLGQEPARPEERSPAEAMRSEVVPPTAQGEAVTQQEIQESVGQTMVEAELRVDQRSRQESPMPQDMPLVADLRGALGSWATGSEPEGRVGEQVTQADDRAACPTFPKIPQQEVTSKVSAAPSSVPSHEGDKVEQNRVGRCFYCKKRRHLQEECPKSLEDEAKGLLTWDSAGVRRDRNENLILKTRGGIRAQLYRQLRIIDF